MKPVTKGERIKLLDALRGFAVFGMFMINIRVFSGYAYIYDETPENLLLTKWDKVFNQIHIVFFEGKFYTLFALLFGIGFAIQIVRASSDNRSFIKHYSRRLFFLLLIGIVHLWGIWFGDILVMYALCGYLLLLFRNVSNNGLIWTAFIVLLIPGVYSLYIQLTDGGFTNNLHDWFSNKWKVMGLPIASDENDTFSFDDMAEIIRHESWIMVMRFNAIGPALRLYITAHDVRIVKILGMFILGLWIGRNILFRRIHENNTFLKKTAITGFIIGLPINILFSIDHDTGMEDMFFIIRGTLDTFGHISLTSAYAATFALLYRTGLRRFIDNNFNAVGRTALSNYIFQSFLGITLFYSVGFGMGEYFGATMLTVAVFAIFGFQILVSKLWLNIFRFGPLEWIWRVLTYGKYIENKPK